MHGQQSKAAQKERRSIAIFIGVVVGLVVGYVFMGTAHAIFEIGAETVPNNHTPTRAIKEQPVVKQQPVIQAQTAGKGGGGTIHTLCTGNGSPYQNIQLRIMYETYKMVQKMPGGEKLTGFTRIMHRSSDDAIMSEIPTFRANPLHPKCDTWCEFPVADRPNAVVQWINAATRDPSMIKGEWLLLVESDYVWMKPLQAPSSKDPTAKGLMYHFDYINPSYSPAIIKRLSGGLDPKVVPPSGPAPALIRFEELVKVAPLWEKVTAQIEEDAEAKKAFDWVREMYAWDIAVAQAGVQVDVKMYPDSPLISQPPHDHGLGAASMYHYTWGVIYKDKETKEQLWMWDKRSYTDAGLALKLPKIPMPPKWREGIVLQDGFAVSQQLHDTLVDMLTQINTAVDNAKVLS